MGPFWPLTDLSIDDIKEKLGVVVACLEGSERN